MGVTAIIGGTGFYDLGLMENAKEEKVPTPYGDAFVYQGTYKGRPVVFMNRHGAGHSVPPHLINYRANIMALKYLGVDKIIATAATGSLHYEYRPSMFVLADQFLDFTKLRQYTFYEGGVNGVVHCDMTVPYCKELRNPIEDVAMEKNYQLINGGVYVCVEGPRFETAAEIKMYNQMGGHIIGMTSVPEVCLARELGMCYAKIAMITNYAAGIFPTVLTHSEVLEVMRAGIDQMRALVMDSIIHLPDVRTCDCTKILNEPGVNK
jgi:5'-methylthioadenosine phosphorylase